MTESSTGGHLPFPDEAFRRFMLEHKFGMDEVVTKLKILRDEFTHLHDYNPIEHVSSRVKSPESLVQKMRHKGLVPEERPSFDEIRSRVTDIAGVRVVCSFVSDVYRVFHLLTEQQDIRKVEVRDYVRTPKPNGYRSLHALVEVPVFLSGGPVPVVVEVQFRTIAMDFWASLEHKIYYKYRRDVPQELLDGLLDAAQTAERSTRRWSGCTKRCRASTTSPPRSWTVSGTTSAGRHPKTCSRLSGAWEGPGPDHPSVRIGCLPIPNVHHQPWLPG
jgi:putative GTP pyrophosphokinase